MSALTLCGPVATDEDVRSNIAEALAALCLLVTNRSATLAETGHSTFQPTPDDPAVGIVIDEVDEIVAHVPGAGKALDFLASKQRKSAVFLLLATQRAVIAALGGGMVRANMSEVLVGMVDRATESRHATGAEKEIPDIREYAKGAPGYFQRWDPHSGTVTGRGRAFLLGKPPDELAYIKRLVTARRPLRDWSIPDMPPLALDGGQAAAAAVTDATTQQIAGLRGRLASITQAATQPARRPPRRPPPAVRIPPGIPPQIGQTLLELLEAPGAPRRQRPGSRSANPRQPPTSTWSCYATGASPRKPAAAGRPGAVPHRRPRHAGPAPEDAPPPAGVRHRGGPRRHGARRPGRRRRRHPGGTGTGPPDQGPAAGRRPHLTVVQPPEDAAGDGT